jgi:histidine kinase
MAAMSDANFHLPTLSPIMGSLFAGFQQALMEAIVVASLAGLLTAVGVSYFVSRRILRPVHEMNLASRAMVAGRYDRRVNVESEDELGALAKNFNSMAETLGETERMRQQLIGDIAHELRTPLTTVKGYMEGLMDGVIPPSQATFEMLDRETGRLARLVNDLQELSRAESKQMELQYRSFDVGNLVHAAVNRLQQQFEAKGLSLDTSIEPGLPLIRGDEDRITQVLANLIGNALQHTPAEGSVRVAVQQERRHLKVSVSDTGEGLAQENLNRVFERFYRVDKSRSRGRGGSGIGLTISRHIIEAHGGRIWAESPGLGCGSTFAFTLPTQRDTAPSN